MTPTRSQVRTWVHSAASLAVAGLLGASAAARTSAGEVRPLFQDVSEPIETRVVDLISRMTLAEKVAQMRNTAPAIERLGVPPFEDYSMRGRTYRFFTGSPLYPFGHGLSYTRFAYKNLTITPVRPAAGQDVRVSVDVMNAGDRAGDEVVQLYLTDKKSSVPVAIRSLQGFERVRLAAGQTRRIGFTLTPLQMAVINDAGRRIIEPGEFRVAVGGKQPGLTGTAGATTTAVVEGAFVVTGKRTIAQ
jgi:hypothetical protein